jgi:hypothetical protein
LSWTALPTANNGGSPVTFYALEAKDPVSGTWSQQNFDYSNLYYTYTFTSTSVLLPSTAYKFRIRPKNGVGFSLSTSTELSVTSCDYPGASVTLTNGNVEPKSIVLFWTALPTANNGGDEVTFYGVEVRDPVSGTWSQVNNDFSNLYLTYTYT